MSVGSRLFLEVGSAILFVRLSYLKTLGFLIFGELYNLCIGLFVKVNFIRMESEGKGRVCVAGK